MTLTLLEKSNKNKLINIFGIRTTSTQLFINFLQFLSNNKKYINTSDNSKNSAIFRMKIFLFKLFKKIKNQNDSSWDTKSVQTRLGAHDYNYVAENYH